MKKPYLESLYHGYGQYFDVDKILYQHPTLEQSLMIFHNPVFGTVMSLDGVIQTTDRDEFVYHEMLAHVPLFSCHDPERVLIIGGGDGGTLREVLKHQAIKQAVEVEIDRAVVDMSLEYFPNHSKGAYDDLRCKLVIADGIEYVASTSERFDVILVDSTDPIGPGEVLFTDDFYKNCYRCLEPGGVLANQSGVAFHQLDEAKLVYQRLSQHFPAVQFYTAAVPSYIGGVMMFGFAVKADDYQPPAQALLSKRLQQSNIKMRYYNPAIHQASFALPQYIVEAIYG